MRRFVLLLALALPAALPAAGSACAPTITTVQAAGAAPGTTFPAAPPAAQTLDWVDVTLPDHWTRRWPQHSDGTWYRIDWRHDCAQGVVPLAAVVEWTSMAATIHLNDQPVWIDRSAPGREARSWNLPRLFVLPAAALRPDSNTLWVRVRGMPVESPGLGPVHVLPLHEAQSLQQRLDWQRRQLFALNLTISLILAVLFGGIWLLHRRSNEHGWFALACLAWVAFGWHILATDNGPFTDGNAVARFSAVALVAYAACFRMFMARLQRPSPGGIERRSRWLAAGAVMATLAMVLSPAAALPRVHAVVVLASVATFVASCLGFVVHVARRRRERDRDRGDLAIAAIVLLLVLAAVHDVLVLERALGGSLLLTPFAGLLLNLAIGVVLASRTALAMRRIERFNEELNRAVVKACTDLETAMRHERDLAVANSRLQERLALTYDLHDGLGSAIGRAIAVAEQSPDASNAQARHLSTLRSLRDDLRQIIDNGPSQAGASASPTEWVAPTRHRFSTLFDELDIHGQWQVPGAWPVHRPTPRQCLSLTRVLEEALTNAVKHSRARNISIALAFPGDAAMQMDIVDDGIGFDPESEAREGRGIGMRSMHDRLRNLGGSLEVESRPGRTRIVARLPLHAAKPVAGGEK